MNKPTFFISSRSHSADLLASELVLAVCDQYPKVEVAGVLGKWTARTRATPMVELDDLLHAAKGLGLTEGLAPLTAQLLEAMPQIAVLVGYSDLHHSLAEFFKSHEIPVILYEVTPQQALQGVDPKEAHERIKIALSIHKAGSDFIRAASIPFHYIGTPYRDRVAKVVVQPKVFAFLSDKPLVTLFPGGYGEVLGKMIPRFGSFAAGILAASDCQIVVSLREEQDFDAMVAAMKAVLPAKADVHFILGMHLELLSLSRLAITGSGAITIEAAIFGRPFIPIYDPGDTVGEGGYYSLVNQSLGRDLIPEYSSETPLPELIAVMTDLLKDGAQRSALLQSLDAAQEEFLGSAADNAADYLALEAGLGKKRTKPAAAGIPADAPSDSSPTAVPE